MNKTIISVILGVLLLTGCTQAIGVTKYAIQTDAEFNQLFLKDAQTANILAKATNDRLAVKCYTYLEQFTIDNTPTTAVPEGNTAGVLAVYQKARNVRRTVKEVEVSDELRLACGPMLMESTGALGRLGIRLVL